MTPDKTVPGGGLPLGGMSADDGPASHQSASPRNKAEVGDRAGAQSQTKGVLRSVQAKRPFSTNEYSGINRIAAIGSIVFVIGTTTGLAPERNTDQPFKWSPTAAVTTDGRTDSATTPGQHLNAETETRTHVEVMLDSMLITQRVPAGVAFEQRIGEVNDPRILEVMRDIDNTLGGRIEWPNVYVSDDLTAPQWTGQIRPFVDTANPAISGVPRRELSSTSRRPVLARWPGPWCASCGGRT